MPSHTVRKSLRRGLSVLAGPGMYLLHKYTQYKRTHQESQRKKATEKELQCLHLKIDKLLNNLDENDSAIPRSEEEECVVCLSAKATMQTFPCGHIVVCRKCFVKTIQVAVAQRCLPLLCVVCRTKIYRLNQTGNSPPLTPPPSRPHFQLPWQYRRSRSPQPRTRYARSGGQRPSSLARQLFGGSSGSGGGRVEHIPSSNNNNNKVVTSASKTGSNQSKPVATKLMKPLLIYPSEKNLPTQHQGFCTKPSAMRNTEVASDNIKNHNVKKQVRFASPVRMHYSPVHLMCPSTQHMQSNPQYEPSNSIENRLSSIPYADCFSPRLSRTLNNRDKSFCTQESYINPYRSVVNG